ncbi:hypothetical protein CSB66_2750 [Enterobacter hormaechei]|nr:hypothetical protein CSB66_2750 [Enterobacter hormaechei]
MQRSRGVLNFLSQGRVHIILLKMIKEAIMIIIYIFVG